MLAPSPEEQLEIIKRRWYPEASAIHAASMALRGCQDGVERMELVTERQQHLECSDALCDAYNDLRSRIGNMAVQAI